MSWDGKPVRALTASTTGHATTTNLTKHEKKRASPNAPPANRAMHGTRKSPIHDLDLCSHALTFGHRGFSRDRRVISSAGSPASSTMSPPLERSLPDASMVSGTRHSATGPEHENTMDADRGTEDHESEQYPLRVINDRLRNNPNGHRRHARPWAAPSSDPTGRVGIYNSYITPI